MRHNEGSFIKRWWDGTPDWVIGILIATVCTIGLIYGACNIRSCVRNDRDSEVFASVQMKYDCPKSKMKILETNRIGNLMVYRVDVCGVIKRFKCTKGQDGCNLKSCKEIENKKKVKK